VAKNDFAHRSLAAQLETHAVWREYTALVQGGFHTDGGTVDLPIGRHPTDRKRMAVIRDGAHTARHAVTHYRVLERFGAITYLALRLETGRTHQIRVHMSHLGHPLLGDTVYGGGGTPFEKRHAALLSGQALHAGKLGFTHPRTEKEMLFEAPMPAEMQELLRILRSSAL
jgi:23S rRNA pseudouridine1911/1915/1917 synthase